MLTQKTRTELAKTVVLCWQKEVEMKVISHVPQKGDEGMWKSTEGVPRDPSP